MTNKTRKHRTKIRQTMKRKHHTPSTSTSTPTSERGVPLKDLVKHVGKYLKLRTKTGKIKHMWLTGHAIERSTPKSMVQYRDWIRTRHPTLPTRRGRQVEIEFDDCDTFEYFPLKNGVVEGISLM